MLERILRWIAPALGVVAALWLPAFTAIAPLLPPERWTVLQLVHPADRNSLSGLLANIRRLGAAAHAGPHFDTALRYAAAIPVMAVAGGVCALLALLLQASRRTRGLVTLGVAGVGLACTVFAIAAASWVTAAAHRSLNESLARYGGKLGLHDLAGIAASFQSQTQLRAEAGLYVLAIVFVVLLVLPLPRTAPLD